MINNRKFCRFCGSDADVFAEAKEKTGNKKIFATVLAAAMMFTSAPVYAFSESIGFSDVPAGAWYADAVAYVNDNGIMSGTDSDTFSPDGETSRAMIWTILARLENENTAPSKGEPWYQPGSRWAAENGISDGTDPTGNITREQLITMLYRNAGSPQIEVSADVFADESQISPWALDAAHWAWASGIVSGNRCAPKNNASRAETADMIYRYLEDTPITVREQGIFSAGGVTLTSDGTFDPENQWEETGAGQTAHVDHANVLYQIPEKETGLPMVFLHGYGQSRMGWMTTPDGREGWSDMFLRMGHSVFLVDQPRRGEAGATSVSGDISTKTLDQRWYTQFHIGRWENGRSVVNEGSQFPNDDASVDQFFRQMTPDTGMTSDMGSDFDNETVAKALAATVDEVYRRTGKNSVVVTHSQGGGPGWTAAGYTNHIATIVAIEPGGAPSADSEDYRAVTEKKIPVVFYFGDYIDNGDPAIAATSMWQFMRQACYDFASAYTAQGGRCMVVDLPKEGITGNDHFMFQDLNNDVIAEHVEAWIKANV